MLPNDVHVVKVTFFDWNLKWEKPQRQRRRSTHDVTERISTLSLQSFQFTSSCERWNGLGDVVCSTNWCQTPWIRFNYIELNVIAWFLSQNEVDFKDIRSIHILQIIISGRGYVQFHFNLSQINQLLRTWSGKKFGGGGGGGTPAPHLLRHCNIRCFFLRQNQRQNW